MCYLCVSLKTIQFLSKRKGVISDTRYIIIGEFIHLILNHVHFSLYTINCYRNLISRSFNFDQ